MCTLPEYGGKGMYSFFYVADSKATFVDLLGLEGRNKNRRQSSIQRLSQKSF